MSSIAFDPRDLPKDFKAFVQDTFDEQVNAEVTIPSTYLKASDISKSKNSKIVIGGSIKGVTESSTKAPSIKLSKVKDYDTLARKTNL